MHIHAQKIVTKIDTEEINLYDFIQSQESRVHLLALKNKEHRFVKL